MKMDAQTLVIIILPWFRKDPLVSRSENERRVIKTYSVSRQKSA